MAGPRFYIDRSFVANTRIGLPPGPARHAQVLRLQPGQAVTLFNGQGGEWSAEVVHMGRAEVQVLVHRFDSVEREISSDITWAIGMPTNERMDNLVEKVTELGVTRLQPLMTDRSILRLQPERAIRKLAHWQAVAVASCEQCGRNRVPVVEPVLPLSQWLETLPKDITPGMRQMLSLRQAAPWQPATQHSAMTFLSGPEGGLSEQEEAMAQQCGFTPVSLGPRTLRADTAPLMVLSMLALMPTQSNTE